MLEALVISAACSWDNPGANPYRGSVPAAVHSYTDIPLETRNRLQQKMEKRQYDEIVDIRRDRIAGKHDYVDLRDMHFGGNRLCRTVSMSKWGDQALERGLIYCEGAHCLIVPTVCNNVSRVTRLKTFERPKDQGAGQTQPLAPEVYGFPLAKAPIVDVGPIEPSFKASVEQPPLGRPSAPWTGYVWPQNDPRPSIIIYTLIVPEPSTWLTMGLSLGAVLLWARRRLNRRSS